MPPTRRDSQSASVTSADPEPALRCVECGLHYPVRDGIPWMLEEEAFRPE